MIRSTNSTDSTKPKKKNLKNPLYVDAADFDVTKYYIDPCNTDDKIVNENMYITFPKYKYTNCDKLVVLTNPITLVKDRFGIPTVDGHMYLHENHCMYIWIQVTDENIGLMDFCNNVLKPLDSYNNNKIVENKNVDFFGTVDNTGNITYLKKLKYRSLIRTNTYPNGEYDGYDNDSDDVMDNPHDKRSYIKIKISTGSMYNSEDKYNVNEPKKILTRIYTDSGDGTPKNKPENIQTLDDVRNILKPNSVVQFAIEFSSFWALRMMNDDGRLCGMNMTAIQMFVK